MKLLPAAPSSERIQRASTRSTSGGFANGFEMVGVVIVFALMGFGLDAWLGTRPWCTIVLSVLGIVGTFARTYYAYTAEMQRLEAERAAPRPKAHTVGTEATS